LTKRYFYLGTTAKPSKLFAVPSKAIEKYCIKEKEEKLTKFERLVCLKRYVD